MFGVENGLFHVVRVLRVTKHDRRETLRRIDPPATNVGKVFPRGKILLVFVFVDPPLLPLLFVFAL